MDWVAPITSTTTPTTSTTSTTTTFQPNPTTGPSTPDPLSFELPEDLDLSGFQMPAIDDFNWTDYLSSPQTTSAFSSPVRQTTPSPAGVMDQVVPNVERPEFTHDYVSHFCEFNFLFSWSGFSFAC